MVSRSSRGAALVLDRAVVDLLSGVVAEGPGCGGLRTDAQVAFVCAEHHPVEVVDRPALEAPGRDDAVQRGHQICECMEAQVSERDERLHGLELDAQADGIAQRAVGIGEGAVQVCMPFAETR